MLLGCIGDDFTGSSDIGNTLNKAGMRVTQYNGIPNNDADSEVEAGIVALKTRSIATADAVEQSVAAAKWLLAQGCEQLYFKYCSTFDSTKEGNIGPVCEALAALTGEDKVIICPAFPATGRTVYQGNLFVDDVPLSESGMKDHPLTPMTDADIRRWLGYQTAWTVEHLNISDIEQGEAHLRDKIAQFGNSMIVADIIRDENFAALAHALGDRKLVTGASGLALNLPDNFRQKGKLADAAQQWQGVKGPAAILCGSCSKMTRAQVARYATVAPSKAVTAFEIIAGKWTPSGMADWIDQQSLAPLIYSSDAPAEIKRTQDELGTEKAAQAIEGFFGQLAVELMDRGMRKIVCAGGETSGAIVTALGIDSISIGPEISPGVPALRVDDNGLLIVLKSGNFGEVDFFESALKVLDHE